MNSAQKARILRAAADQVRAGWTKRTLQDDRGNVCLVGALNAVTGGFTYPNEESLALQQDLASELIRTDRQTRKGYDVMSVFGMGSDFGLMSLERWNDRRFRRKGQVIALLERVAERYEELAKDERIAELEEKVGELQGRIVKLQRRIELLEVERYTLRDEVSLWKARRARITAEEMTASSKVLRELDSSLTRVFKELELEKQRVSLN